MNEIDEFYSYVEMPQVAENLKAWNGSFQGGTYASTSLNRLDSEVDYIEWIRSEFQKRKAHVEILLESLEHRDAEIRFTNARRLFYVLQGAFILPCISPLALTVVSPGTFAETTSPEHQLHWIFENCKVVRAANGLSTIVEAMKIATSKHDLL